MTWRRHQDHDPTNDKQGIDETGQGLTPDACVVAADIGA